MFIIKIKRIKIVTLLINVSDLCAQDLFSLYILRYLEGSMRTQVLNYVETVQYVWELVVIRVLFLRIMCVHKEILYKDIYGCSLCFVCGC